MRAVRAGREFVDRYGLHIGEDAWVDLRHLHDFFHPVLDDLSDYGVDGYAFFPPDGEVGPTRPAKVFIEATLSDRDQRLVYSHELGHFACGHLATPLTASLDWAIHDRTEREAWLAAAAILIPLTAFEYDHSSQAIAFETGTSIELVELYRDSIIR